MEDVNGAADDVDETIHLDEYRLHPHHTVQFRDPPDSYLMLFNVKLEQAFAKHAIPWPPEEDNEGQPKVFNTRYETKVRERFPSHISKRTVQLYDGMLKQFQRFLILIGDFESMVLMLLLPADKRQCKITHPPTIHPDVIIACLP
jgi:hypothetical protein